MFIDAEVWSGLLHVHSTDILNVEAPVCHHDLCHEIGVVYQ